MPDPSIPPPTPPPDQSTDPNVTKPLVVTVASLAGTGTGSGLIETPHGQQNVYLKVVSPLAVIGVRALRVYLQTMLGVVMAGPATGLIPARDFNHLLLIAASVSFGAAVICILQNAVELLAKFDQSHPTLAG